MIKSVIAKVAATAGLALTAATVAAGPAQAAGQYNDSLSLVGPTIYQTNNYYTSASVGSTVTPNGPIITVGWDYSFNTALPAGTTMKVDLCNATKGCVSTGTGYGWTDAFNGLPANSKFYYRFNLSSSTTKVLNPPISGARDYITVGFMQP